ncbi:YceI family protein [Nocardioides rubriscoriae]|uniref:YceI family protein n=1 Tax=Nocardioides rubriscoriae TaxID=642762 RepID=UPI0011DF48F0|nr:YceI family protein [Nocardioides rubriscoriae]
MALFSRKNRTPATTSAPATGSTPTTATTTAVAPDISGSYTIDPSHTRVGFNARHAMVTSVRGAFGDLSGHAVVDTAVPSSSSVELVLKTASVDTGSADRDGHLVSADFFDAETHPDITFASTAVVRDGDTWSITGDLTIKGTTKPVTIDFDFLGTSLDPFGNTRIGFEGATTVNRKDWGLTWNAALETGGVLVSDKIKLEFDVSAIKNA